MTGVIILSLLCLALVSLALRAVLLAQGENVDRRFSRIASIAGSIGFLPLIIFEWACNVAMVVLLPRGFAYLIAPERITAWLDVQLTCSA
jgi:hypothetical protein